MVRKKSRAQLALEKAQREYQKRLQQEEPVEYIDKELKKSYPKAYVGLKRKRRISKSQQQLIQQQQQIIPQQKRRKQPRPTKAKASFDQHAGIRGLIKSSWINYLFYNDQGNVIARFNGVNYTIYKVPFLVYQGWRDGEAACKTWDTSKLKRWKPGKSPSRGAFYDQHIKGKYRIQRGIH